jgi:hypothetical protein
MPGLRNTNAVSNTRLVLTIEGEAPKIVQFLHQFGPSSIMGFGCDVLTLDGFTSFLHFLKI